MSLHDAVTATLRDHTAERAGSWGPGWVCRCSATWSLNHQADAALAAVREWLAAHQKELVGAGYKRVCEVLDQSASDVAAGEGWDYPDLREEHAIGICAALAAVGLMGDET